MARFAAAAPTIRGAGPIVTARVGHPNCAAPAPFPRLRFAIDRTPFRASISGCEKPRRTFFGHPPKFGDVSFIPEHEIEPISSEKGFLSNPSNKPFAGTGSWVRGSMCEGSEIAVFHRPFSTSISPQGATKIPSVFTLFLTHLLFQNALGVVHMMGGFDRFDNTPPRTRMQRVSWGDAA